MKVQIKKDLNVFLLSLAFLLVFTAFITMTSVQPILIENAKHPNSSGMVPDFEGNGFISQGVLYGVAAVFYWMAPSVIAMFGHKVPLIIGASTYTVYIASFLWMNEILLYSASALIGFGSSLIWTGQGAFLTANSDVRTMSRNSGIFWAIFKLSGLVGSLYYYFQFSGVDDIDAQTRELFVGVLTALSALGLICFFTLLPTPQAGEQISEKVTGPLVALKEALELLTTPDMIILSIFFFHTGLERTFSGVFGTCLGFTKSFGDNYRSLPGLHGIAFGVGGILGGLLFGIVGKLDKRIGRWPIVLLGSLVQFIAFVLAFLNLANDVTINKDLSNGDSIIFPSRISLALLASLLLGFGDACYNTQIMSLIGIIYPDKSSCVYAIFKFMQCVSSACSFVYTNYLPLHWHIGLLWAFGTMATLAFLRIDMKNASDPKEKT